MGSFFRITREEEGTVQYNTGIVFFLEGGEGRVNEPGTLGTKDSWVLARPHQEGHGGTDQLLGDRGENKQHTIMFDWLEASALERNRRRTILLRGHRLGRFSSVENKRDYDSMMSLGLSDFETVEQASGYSNLEQGLKTEAASVGGAEEVQQQKERAFVLKRNSGFADFDAVKAGPANLGVRKKVPKMKAQASSNSVVVRADGADVFELARKSMLVQAGKSNSTATAKEEFATLLPTAATEETAFKKFARTKPENVEELEIAVSAQSIAEVTQVRYESLLIKVLYVDLAWTQEEVHKFLPIGSEEDMKTFIALVFASWQLELRKEAKEGEEPKRPKWHSVQKLKASIVWYQEQVLGIGDTWNWFKHSRQLGRFYKGLRMCCDNAVQEKLAPTGKDLFEIHAGVAMLPIMQQVLVGQDACMGKRNWARAMRLVTDEKELMKVERQPGNPLKSIACLIRGLFLFTACMLGERRNSEGSYAKNSELSEFRGGHFWTIPRMKNDVLGVQGTHCFLPVVEIGGFFQVREMLAFLVSARKVFVQLGWDDRTNDHVAWKFSNRGSMINNGMALCRVEPGELGTFFRELMVKVDSGVLKRKVVPTQLISFRKGGVQLYSKYSRTLAQVLGGWKSVASKGGMMDRVYAKPASPSKLGCGTTPPGGRPKSTPSFLVPPPSTPSGAPPRLPPLWSLPTRQTPHPRTAPGRRPSTRQKNLFPESLSTPSSPSPPRLGSVSSPSPPALLSLAPAESPRTISSSARRPNRTTTPVLRNRNSEPAASRRTIPASTRRRSERLP